MCALERQIHLVCPLFTGKCGPIKLLQSSFSIIRYFLPNLGRILHRWRRAKIKNCHYWGLNPQPPDYHSNALLTMLARNLLERRFLNWALFVSYTTSHFGLWLFLESIEHDYTYKGLNDWHRQPNSDLAQLTEHESDDLEVVGSIPSRGNFLFCSSPSMLAVFCQKITNYRKTRW